MKLLILGGTRFVGRFLTEAALARGHEVTLFNRGNSSIDMFQNVERLIGDRKDNLEALRGRHWDAVIDTCGFFPNIVRQSAKLLKDAVKHYTFISSVSVYNDLTQRVDENSPVSTISSERLEEVTTEGAGPYYGPEYGALKSLCEQELETLLPGRVLHIRPGLIVGPYDYSDRFTYWPTRVAKGGDVLVPEGVNRQIQTVDVRDLADWNIRAIEESVTGIFNVSGATYTMGELLETCKSVSHSDANFVWVDTDFLNNNEVGEWKELPLWLKSLHGMFDVNNSKIFTAGFTTRPLEETVIDTWKWDRTRPTDEIRKAGLHTTKEAELLQNWFFK
jgi:2'-hydroxyisoflavone reductase